RAVGPILALAALGLVGGLLWLAPRARRRTRPPLESAAVLAEAAAHPDRPLAADPLLEALRSDLQVHRKLLVLFADEARLEPARKQAALAAGHRLHHEERELAHQLNGALTRLASAPSPERRPVLLALLDWMDTDPDRMEPDRLAFRDPLRVLQKALAKDTTPEGTDLKARLAAHLAEVDRVETWVDAEYRAARGGRRPRWEAYLAALQARYPLDQLLGPPPAAPQSPGTGEITGSAFPEKVLVLSFDDGPHRVYTEEIKALLQGEHLPALFFEVGRNLGTVDATGQVRLGPMAAFTEDLAKAGFVVGNHSYTHAQLSKETGAPLDQEIRETDRLLQAIPGAHSQLFRFPYGARTPVQLAALQPYHLRSVLWTIDSLDWADPVPSSVADRVLREVEKEKRGILLFHDIHDRAGKVLPMILPKLRAEGYVFAGLDSQGRLVLP
ncbi:MAG TPA: polysaccharide deacetylase family protein, partial [Holophagaceae bacterium]